MRVRFRRESEVRKRWAEARSEGSEDNEKAFGGRVGVGGKPLERRGNAGVNEIGTKRNGLERTEYECVECEVENA